MGCGDDGVRRCRAVLSWAVVLAATVCRASPGTGQTEPADGPLRIYVSIPPQKYFVERIGGPHVQVSVLLAPGQSPHTYEITLKQMVDLAGAKAYFRIGVPFEENVVAKIRDTLPDLNIVDTRRGIELRAMTASERHEHDTDTDHDHAAHDERGEIDPHVWMNPRFVKIQAHTIGEELKRLDPAHGQDYERRLRDFEADLDRLDAAIAARLALLRGREFFVFHPAYGYFADAYGLRQVAVQSGGKAPAAKQLGAMIQRAKEAGVRSVFIQPQFDRSNADAIAEAIGGAVVSLDPLAEDYMNNLLDITAKIEQALTPHP